ncbi:MAG: ornithine carbamoyltransferase, partial [Gammaproteobacteria bacterium]|nr:ornithine carbamoyltransferase [Gammaproteobacteria bacterium]
MKPTHFLSLFDLQPPELRRIIRRGIELKGVQKRRQEHHTCAGSILGMIFELSSTRTRVAFESGMYQLGGTSIFLSPVDTQLGRGEPIEDTARVVSRMVDIVMIRAKQHETIVRFAEYSSVPVINGMSNTLHPCQLLADIQTFVEHRGSIEGKRVAFVGDGYNMCNSYVEAAVQFDFELHVATPREHAPDVPRQAESHVSLHREPNEAVADADLVVTDVWSSMGHEQEHGRKNAFEGYQVTSKLLDKAKDDCIFLHCLPAHRGEEVDEYVFDDTRPVEWG